MDTSWQSTLAVASPNSPPIRPYITHKYSRCIGATNFRYLASKLPTMLHWTSGGLDFHDDRALYYGGKVVWWWCFSMAFQLQPNAHVYTIPKKNSLGGGFKHVSFSPLSGAMIQFDICIFLKEVENHQLVSSRAAGPMRGLSTTVVP